MTCRAVGPIVILLALSLCGCTTDTLSVPSDDDTLTTSDDATGVDDDTSNDGDEMTDADSDTPTGNDDPVDGDAPDEDGADEGSGPDAAPVLFVDATATGAGNGADWVRVDPPAGCARGRGTAAQIRVAQGTYQPTETADRDASFVMVTDVEVLGGYAGLAEDDPDARDIVRYATVLSGDLLADDGPAFTNRTDNTRHVITVNAGVENSVLDGFTITGGFADGMSSAMAGQGGGLHKVSGHFALRDCRITGNYATTGGGLRNSAGSLIMVHCTVRDNAAQLTGAGIYVAGGSVTVVNAEVQRNHASNGGGGLYSVFGATSLHNVAFVGNSTDFNGGGIYVQDGTVAATNVAVTANQVNRDGGGIYVLGGACTLTNCIVWANLAAGVAGLDAQIDTASGTVTAFNSCIGDENATDASIPFGGLANRNLDDDPRFLVVPDPGDDGLWDGVDDTLGYLGLSPDSPCIDVGDTAALPPDIADADRDADTAETLPVDMVGNDRVRSADVDLGPHES